MQSRMILAATLLVAAFPAGSAHAVEHRGVCTVVPWTAGAAPTIKVRIDGQGPFTFVVDTGAEGDGWIKPELAARLKLAVVGKVPPDGPDDPEQDVRLFAAGRLQLGTMTFAAPRFGEMLQMGPKAQAFDGIIGSALFERLKVAFDYRNRQLLVMEAPLTGGQVVAFDRGMPIVPLQIGERRVEAHLDTGNIAGPLFVDDAVAQALPLAGPAVAKGTVRTHYGEQSILEAPLAAPVRFGGTTLPVTIVRWPPAIGLTNLGSRGLEGMLVQIDARTKRIAMQQAGGALRCR